LNLPSHHPARYRITNSNHYIDPIIYLRHSIALRSVIAQYTLTCLEREGGITVATTLKINWSFTSRIDGGPQLSESQPVIEVTAYDYMVVPVASSAKTDINLPSATGAQMVAILATKYSAKVTYVIDGAPTPQVLDGPHIFIGPGAVAFLGATAPKKLTFTNSSPDMITVQVFVGRPA
jgi:hypothetical protein